MKKRLAMPLSFAALALCIQISRHGAVAEVDAVSAASLTVGVSNITATSASIDYSKDRYRTGTRKLCYNPAPAAPTQNCVSRQASGNAGSFAVTNLLANTQYNFIITASDGRHRDYSTSGTFKTLATSALRPAVPGLGPRTDADRFDALGRNLEPKAAPVGRGVIFTNRMAEPAYHR